MQDQDTGEEAARLEAALERIAAARPAAPVPVAAEIAVRLDQVIADLRAALS